MSSPNPAIELHAAAALPDALQNLCKAAGETLRLSILRVLARDAYSVQELCTLLDCRQSGMSHHLKVLATAGLVATRREGNTIYYRRDYRAVLPALEALQHSIFEAADQLPLDRSCEQRLAAIRAERAARSAQFFAENAADFEQHQEQVAAWNVYAGSTAELLYSSLPDGGELAIEIGPGTGEFLPLLADKFSRVIALDNAPAMLEQARALCQRQKLDNIGFIAGDTASPELPVASADAVVINMVLHHVPSPAAIFGDVAKLLKPGGLLSVTDLCSHDQSWTREACGDLWLGFNSDDLSQWAQAAGLEEGPSVYMAQRNGFRIQVRHFENAPKTH